MSPNQSIGSSAFASSDLGSYCKSQIHRVLEGPQCWLRAEFGSLPRAKTSYRGNWQEAWKSDCICRGRKTCFCTYYVETGVLQPYPKKRGYHQIDNCCRALSFFIIHPQAWILAQVVTKLLVEKIGNGLDRLFSYSATPNRYRPFERKKAPRFNPPPQPPFGMQPSNM